jgi:hypothetical protein
MHVYFISGLGADQKAFQRLTLSERFTIHYIEWKQPLKRESLNAYAKRLAKSVDTSQSFSLIGLSFGGMIATEVSTFLNPFKTILISSTYSSGLLPAYVRWISRIKLHKLVPASWLKLSAPLAHWFFGTKTTSEKKLLDQIMHDTDDQFLQWAINAILTWKNRSKPSNCIRIHGDNDRLLPHFADADVIIKGGGHFMVFNKANEISTVLENYLSQTWDK